MLDVALNPHEEAYQKAKGVKEEEKAAAAWLKGVCSWLGSMPRLWHRRSYACIYRLSSCGIVYDLASKSAPTYISCHIGFWYMTICFPESQLKRSSRGVGEVVQRGSSSALARWDSVSENWAESDFTSSEPLQGMGEKSGEVHSSWVRAVSGRRPRRDPSELPDESTSKTLLCVAPRERQSW